MRIFQRSYCSTPFTIQKLPHRDLLSIEIKVGENDVCRWSGLNPLKWLSIWQQASVTLQIASFFRYRGSALLIFVVSLVKHFATYCAGVIPYFHSKYLSSVRKNKRGRCCKLSGALPVTSRVMSAGRVLVVFPKQAWLTVQHHIMMQSPKWFDCVMHICGMERRFYCPQSVFN